MKTVNAMAKKSEPDFAILPKLKVTEAPIGGLAKCLKLLVASMLALYRPYQPARERSIEVKRQLA